jgi:putative DNA primase/helicase
MMASEIHERVDWPAVLAQLGVPVTALRNKHGPCPACHGTDRFRFDNRRGRGDYICNQCGAGSGFDLLMKLHGWDFRTARNEVMRVAGLSEFPGYTVELIKPASPPPEPDIAQPSDRVLRLRGQSCGVADCNDAVEYLASRKLWPLPEGCSLRAHPSVEYFEDKRCVGRFAALLAPVLDLDGQLVTMHVTYLQNGAKITDHKPRKMLSPLTNRVGCAARIMQLDGDALGVGEGLESSIAAGSLHGLPVWSALNAPLLSKFEPPAQIKRLIVYCDHDVAGLDAALKLIERLQGKVRIEIKTPTAPAKDWAEVLANAKQLLR